MKRIGIAVVLALCGCHPAPSNNADSFYGTWNGTIDESDDCSSFSSPATGSYPDTLTITQDSNDNVTVTSASDDCTYTGSASGETITLDANQSCGQYPEPDGTIVTFTVTTGTLTYDSSGNLQYNLSGDATIQDGTTGTPLDDCPVTRTASLSM